MSAPTEAGVRCEVCGNPLISRIDTVVDPQSGEHFRILECGDCGLGHTFPVPKDPGAYYGRTYYGERHSFTASYCAARRVRILEHVTRGATGTLLDIGCGEGTFLLAAAKRGHQIAGTELGGAADRARSLGVEVHASLEEFASPVEPRTFDAITMWHTLEHFVSPSRTVATAASLLKQTGVFIVAVPDAEGLQARLFRQNWFHLDVPRHLFHFGRRSLSRLLEQSGFRIERWHHMEFEYDMFGWMQSGLNALLPEPNVLFQSMTGKPVLRRRLPLLAHYAIGSVIAPFAFGATLGGAAIGRGGTLIAVARRTASAGQKI